MLTINQYNELWANKISSCIYEKQKKPDYNEYINRENQIQDYIDIFRGRNTRKDLGIRKFIPEVYYYEHPFADLIDEKKSEIKIKYLIIGEAAPLLINYITRYSANDETSTIANHSSEFIENETIERNSLEKENSYFYNIYHTKRTPYLSATCKAFNVVGNSKKERLSKLAKCGVLLLDLYPFAIEYDTIDRIKLNRKGVTNYFWTDAHESIESRIQSLINSNLLHNDFKLALIAPQTISHQIADFLNKNKTAKYRENIRLGTNNFTPTIYVSGTPLPPYFSNIPSSTKLIGIKQLTYDLSKNKKRECINVPTYACCCYNKSGQGPHELFIKNAFGLI